VSGFRQVDYGGDGGMMSIVDVAIPGLIGLAMFVWPRFMFFGSRVPPNEAKIRWLRYAGAFLLLVAALNLVVKFTGR
jgi:hypothetical protein